MIKKQRLDKQSKTVDEDIKKYFKVKEEAKRLMIIAKDIEKSVISRESSIASSQKVIDKDKEDNRKEKERLNAWGIDLKKLEADLEDIRKLNKIEQRELDKKRKILQDLRK